MKMSTFSFKALTEICDNPGITIPEFAKRLYPDNPLWHVSRQDGKGKGYKMLRVGQDYLGRLLKAGWVKETFQHTGISKSGRKFYITESGETAIDSFANQIAAKISG